MANYPINSVGDELMFRLDRDEATEAAAQHEHRSQTQEAAEREKGEAEPTQALAAERGDVEPVCISGKERTRETENAQRADHPAVGPIFPHPGTDMARREPPPPPTPTRH